MSSKRPHSRRGSVIETIRRHPSMVVAVLALAFSMVGTAAAMQATDQGASKAAKKKGKRGPRGPAGPQGPAGPAGPSGFTGLVEVNTSSPYNATDFKSAPNATCPAGKVAVGGGAIVTSDTDGSPIALKRSGPTSPGANNWVASAFEAAATTDSWNVQVSLWCANPAP
jgi:hypothetical protein